MLDVIIPMLFLFGIVGLVMLLAGLLWLVDGDDGSGQCPEHSGAFYGYRCERERGHEGKHLVVKSVTRDAFGREVGRTTVEWWCWRAGWTHVAVWSYVTGRAGRVSSQRRALCAVHAEVFARRHGIEEAGR